MPPYHALLQQASHRLRDFRLFLPNPTFANPPWDRAGFHVLVVRLSPFTDVERSTPHLLLSAEVRSALPDAYVDTAFLPRHGDAAVLAEAGLPFLLGTQSHRSLEDFDLALVSNSWLLEQVNLPFLLARSGIPVWASGRDDSWPPIILGGSNATAAHALVDETGDAIPDAIFFGEGEEAIGQIALICREASGLSKKARLLRLAAEVTGLWIAGSRALVKKARVRVERLCARTPAAPPVFPGDEAGTVRLAITRGCPCLCSFCFEGFDRKPFRELPAASLVTMARALKKSTGADTVEVDSFTFSSHEEIGPLLVALHRLFLHVNLMSQRVDVLARTPGLLDLEIAAGKASFTLGIEGISGSLRTFLHKSLPDEDIRSVLEALHARRTREIKLFFLLTGHETVADTEEFAGFVAELKDIRTRAASLPRIVFSFGLLVRMPFTPLRHDAPALEEAAWKQLIGRVKSCCETNGFEFRLSQSWPAYAATQALALAGHELHGLLMQLAAEGPATDAPMPDAQRAAVERWIRAHRGELEGDKGAAHAFAFPFLDDAATRAMLFRQYTRACAGRDVGYGRSPQRRPRDAASLSSALRTLAPLVEKKRRLVPVAASLLLPREAAGMGARWTEAHLARSLLERFPGQLENILAVREAVVEPLGLLAPDIPWFGVTIVSLTAWDTDGLSAALGADCLPTGAPASVRSLRLRLALPVSLFPHPEESLAAFLRDNHAPVTIVRRGGAARFIVPDKSRKKRMLLEGSRVTSGEEHLLELSIGTRPFIGAWLDQQERGAARQALAQITAMEPAARPFSRAASSPPGSAGLPRRDTRP